MPVDPSTRPTASLGKFLSEHGLRRELRLLYQILGAVGLGGALVMVTIGVWRGYVAYQDYGPALVLRWSMPFWIAAAALALIGIGSLFTLWQRHGIKVRTFANGMTYQRKQKPVVFFWRHVRTIRTYASRYFLPLLGTSGRSELLLTMANRQTLRLTNVVTGLDQLVETVKERVYPRLMSDYVKAFRMGQPIAFGPLTLTLDGIRYGKRSFAWDKVGGTEIKRGRLSVLWDSGDERVSRLSVPTRRIPNVEICFQLIRRLGLHP